MYSRQASVWMVKPGWDRKAGIGHLGQARALASEDIFHALVALGFSVAEEIDILLGGPGQCC